MSGRNVREHFTLFGDDVFERCFRDHDGLNELNICKYNYYILKTDELIFC